MSTSDVRYPPIGDYALISDCRCAALVSRSGSLDWCCMPRIDDDSLFGRLLDWERGGFCAITPTADSYSATRRYLPGTMVLETRFKTERGEALLYDFFAVEADPAANPRYDYVRIVECVAGEVEFGLEICPRFDYGEIVPRMRRHREGVYTAIGSNKGLIIQSNVQFEVVEHYDLYATHRLAAGQKIYLMLRFQYPDLIDMSLGKLLQDPIHMDRDFESTCKWWSDWSSQIHAPFELDERTLRSAITLKALTFEQTGAIAAAATTSLPEAMGGERNWDYRFSWVRDSVFAVWALYRLGFTREAARFQKFIERSAAGSAAELQIMYGVDGKRRLTEVELDWLEGYRNSRPVRIGNGAAKQMQLDIYGELMEMAWRAHSKEYPIDPDYWTFLVDVADTVCHIWQQPDHGIWEMRSEPKHFVHSKVMCWVALNRAIMLAEENAYEAPVTHWKEQRDAIRTAVETQGYDAQRGIFVQAFGSSFLDAVLLLLPRVGFISYQDPRMLRTVDAICAELDVRGLLKRYTSPDNLSGTEGSFLPCTFWLVACLAHQDKCAKAWEYYERAVACSNDVGLFSEEFDMANREMLGNFPQTLTHVSQITARLALAKVSNGNAR